MKTIKSVITWLVVGVVGVAFFVACQHNNVDTQDKPKAPASNALVDLVSLGEKRNPAPSEISTFQDAYRQLSVDELIQYRQIQHQDILRKNNNSKAIEEALKADMAWFKQINQESLAQYGKLVSQLGANDQNKLFVAWDNKRPKAQARAAAGCPIVSFNKTYQKGFGGGFDLGANYASEVDPGGHEDCDCQLAFPTTLASFSKVVPQNSTANALFDSFGGLGGRLLTGASAGSYPVFGKSRVTFYYPGQAFYGCDVLKYEFKLSDQ